MVDIAPFRALRPTADSAPRVLALPYDVMNVPEARAMAQGRPDSFLHVSRAEIDLDESINPYDAEVYAQSGRALTDFVERGVLALDAAPTLSVYRMRMGDLVQVGIVAAATVDDYATGAIRKHELTRPDKENDRVRHIEGVGCHDEPVFLLCPADPAIDGLLEAVTAERPADYVAVADTGVSHEVWVVSEPERIAVAVSEFAAMDALYVADGHHRSAAAERVRDARREAAGAAADLGSAERFLVVIVPADHVTLMPYHRAVTDLAGRTEEEFLAAVAEHFAVEPLDAALQPAGLREFGMYLGGRWYRLRSLQQRDADVLDVDVLQDDLLGPILGIEDPRRDQRIHFIGGIRGLPELERLVDEGHDAVSFSLHPTSVEQLVAVADRGEIMPPKSTWFEPKLGSGLFLHPLPERLA